MNFIYKNRQNIGFTTSVIFIIFILIAIHSYFLIDKNYNLIAVIGFGLLFILTFGRNRRKMYLRLKEHERQLSSLIGNLPGFIYRCHNDKDYTMLFISQGCHEITGYKPDDFLSKRITFMSLITEEFVGPVMNEIENAIAGKKGYKLEYQIRTADNRIKWVLEQGTVVYDSKDQVQFLEGYIQNISDRKEFELEIQERNEDYSRLLNGMNETIWLIDFKGNLVDVNKACVETLGYTRDELLKMGITGIDPSFKNAEFSERMLHESYEKNTIIESVHHAKDGRLIPVELCSSIVRYKGCRVVLAIARDITARKQLEEQQKTHERVQKELLETTIAAKLKAEENERLKMAFLANMSHEIRTPMNGILGFMELLKEPNLEESSRKEYIDLVNQSGQRLLTTINDIIAISKIESGEKHLKPETINLEELMNFHLDFFKPEALAKGIELLIREQISGESACILADRHKLDGILTNLIKNAIKFTSYGHIEFGNYISDESIVFYVKDTGRGIPPDRHFAIFERFVQADNGPTRSHEGSGLGLAIAKAYAEAMKGRIWVTSEPYKGSDFRFMIPYQPVTGDYQTIQSEPKAVSVPKKSMSILVAEDDEISFRIIQSLLNREDIKVTRAANGIEAVNLMKASNDFQMVLMDINMPLMNGLDATRQIREFNPSIPIIAQTAYALEGDKEKTKQAGCTSYISKPIKQAELLKTISKYCPS